MSRHQDHLRQSPVGVIIRGHERYLGRLANDPVHKNGAASDPALRDTLGRSAAEVALMLGYADLAAEIKRAAGARQRAQGLQTR